jgi:gag-polypeptide of LTR copia-type
MAISDPPALSLTIRSTTPIQFTHQIHTSLSHDNFLLWKSQVLPVLRGHGLVGFIDGSKSPPSQFYTTAAGVQESNPAYESWLQQDQLILAWIFSSISAPVLAQVIRCETSASVWSTLNQLHSSQSMAKILDLKLQLQTSKKGGVTCAQFIQHIQSIADQLRSIGTNVSDHDLVLYTLQGLGSEYESFVTALSMRSTYPSMIEFSALLLAHEARLLTNLRSASTTSVHLTTNTTKSNSPSINSTAYYTTLTPQSLAQYQPNSNSNYHGGGRGHSNYRGRGRGRYNYQYSTQYSGQNSFTQTQALCHICNKKGHGALDCYHRFDVRYTASSSQPQALVAEPSPTSISFVDHPAP